MTSTSTNRQPGYRLYTVKSDEKAARWIDIGAAWATRDGKGFTLQLDALPTDGRIVMRENAARENGGQS